MHRNSGSMKVLQVLYSGLGGHGSVVTSLIQADKKNKWEHCLLFYGVEDLLPAYHDFCTDNRIPFSFVKKNKGLFSTGWSSIRRALKKHDPDVVILHSPTLIIPAWLYSVFRGKKVYVVEHTPHATKPVSEKIASFISLTLARKIVCLSSVYRQQLEKQFRLLPVLKKTVVIQNGIDLDKFHVAAKTSSESMHVGMIGRFSTQKNQAMVIATALAGFSSGKLDKTIHFHFAGTGETLAELEKIVIEKRMEANVHFHGLLNEQEIISLLHKLDIYVHASFAETMCTSVMQAMACGLPVLGSDIPGINDIVKAGDNALLFANNDTRMLLEQLTTLYKDANKRKAMAVSARQHATTFFSAEDTFNNYHSLLQNNLL